MLLYCSLIPRPLPDFISQPWRKIGRRPGIIATSRTGNGGLGYYKPIPPFPVRLQDKIWEWPGYEATNADVTVLSPLSFSSAERQGHAHDVIKEYDVSQIDGVVMASGDGLLYEVQDALV